MNAPAPYSLRDAAVPAISAVRAPAIAPVAQDGHAAANDDTVTAVPRHATNPLWMISAALAIFLAAAAVLVSMDY